MEPLEQEVQRKFSVLEDFGRDQPLAEVFLRGLRQVIQAAVASHKTSTLKKIERELDTMAEEMFVVDDSARQFRERYWGPIDSASEGLVAQSVNRAIRAGRIRTADQMRDIDIYLDQIAQGLRKNFLDDEETEELKELARRFVAPKSEK